MVAPDAIENVWETTPIAMKNKLLILYPLTIKFFNGVIYRFVSLFSNSMDFLLFLRRVSVRLLFNDF